MCVSTTSNTLRFLSARRLPPSSHLVPRLGRLQRGSDADVDTRDRQHRQEALSSVVRRFTLVALAFLTVLTCLAVQLVEARRSQASSDD